MKLKFVILLILIIITLSSCTNSNQFESWSGDYEFSEWTPPAIEDCPNLTLFYTIHIYEEPSCKYYADIIIDGWMTMARWKTVVQGDSKSIDLLFDSYLIDNMTVGKYKKGDILLKLRKDGDKILTYWGELEPMVIDNQKSGEVYFVKADSTGSRTGSGD